VNSMDAQAVAERAQRPEGHARFADACDRLRDSAPNSSIRPAPVEHNFVLPRPDSVVYSIPLH
jgi:hypothetical protein